MCLCVNNFAEGSLPEQEMWSDLDKAVLVVHLLTKDYVDCQHAAAELHSRLLPDAASRSRVLPVVIGMSKAACNKCLEKHSSEASNLSDVLYRMEDALYLPLSPEPKHHQLICCAIVLHLADKIVPRWKKMMRDDATRTFDILRIFHSIGKLVLALKAVDTSNKFRLVSLKGRLECRQHANALDNYKSGLLEEPQPNDAVCSYFPLYDLLRMPRHLVHISPISRLSGQHRTAPPRWGR